MLKTFDEWRKDGHFVLKGQKACCKDNGKCYFNENQVISYRDYIKTISQRVLDDKECQSLLRERQKAIAEIVANSGDSKAGNQCATKDETLNWLAGHGAAILIKHHPEASIDATMVGLDDYTNLFDEV